MVTFAHAQVGAGNEVVCGQVWEMIVLHIFGGKQGGGRLLCWWIGGCWNGGRRGCGGCWCELVLVELVLVELALVELALVELSLGEMFWLSDFWLNYVGLVTWDMGNVKVCDRYNERLSL